MKAFVYFANPDLVSVDMGELFKIHSSGIGESTKEYEEVEKAIERVRDMQRQFGRLSSSQIITEVSGEQVAVVQEIIQSIPAEKDYE